MKTQKKDCILSVKDNQNKTKVMQDFSTANEANLGISKTNERKIINVRKWNKN